MGLATQKILEDALLPMLDENIDTVVLGCTHYPFVIPAIQKITGPGVRVIDPSPAVARQTMRLLGERGLLPETLPVEPGQVRLYTSGPAEGLSRLLPLLLADEDYSAYSVEHISGPRGWRRFKYPG